MGRLLVAVLLLAACSSPAPTSLATPIPASGSLRATATIAPSTSGPPPAAPTFIPRLADEVVQANLVTPWDIAFAPDGRMLVTERAGTVQVFESGAAGARKLATLAVANVVQNGESGLMGIAVDPSFATNSFVYVCATRNDPQAGGTVNQVLRYALTGTSWTLDGFVIQTGIRSGGNHDGCRIRFDGTDHLWVTMGETGTSSLAQDPNSLNGKVLRVDPDGAIPADNPIIQGAAGRTAVYTWGNRNPQGIAFIGSDVYEVEHGENDDDEINFIEAGVNYGWPVVHETGGAARGMRDPIWSSGNVTFATSGAAFVTGATWGSWSGSLFVAALKDTSLRRFTVTPTLATQRDLLFKGKYGRLRAAVQGPDGALYLTTSNRDGRGSPVAGDDRIVRIVPSQP
ncbi:MAG: PQQ-dependent sugar dehydrogenase [Chloroflexota bacterium]|nr:PQQ-dependent sugar dehydrogenase [Chloroflexota bacterium]